MADYELDHFKFWQVKKKKISRAVTLLTQVDSSAVPQTLTQLEWIANPVEKTFEDKRHEIHNADDHLVGYRFAPPADAGAKPRWFVVIQNQFYNTPVVWGLLSPTMLLVPASKVLRRKHRPESPLPPWPQQLSHFECYEVSWDEHIGPVQLEDQFDKEIDEAPTVRVGGRKEDIKGLTPAYFCMPASKDGGPIPETKDNLLNHLALYKFEPEQPPLGVPLAVIARDQFSDEKKATWDLGVVRPILLGVPTTKEVSWPARQPHGASPAPGPGPVPAS